MKTRKKKILIINSNLGMGGIESAMVNMANELCKDYDVDLFVYYPEGPMKERLDPTVNILKTSLLIKAMGMSISQAIHSKNVLIILFKLFGSVWAHLFDNRLPIFIATQFQPKLKGYDLAIAYRQETGKEQLTSGFVRVLNRCVEAQKKFAWIHCDSTFFPENQEFNRKYYAKVDKIVGVSKAVSDAFAKMNPELREKTDFCYNFVDHVQLYKKSEEEQSVKYPEDKFICFSASRLDVEKALVRGIKAMAPVFKEYSDIMWYIAGDGPERKNIEAAIKEENLQDQIFLLGNQNNPYPYMKNADLFMLISYHEAAPMVYTEAKELGVPIFTTKTLSSEEMLKDGVNAFVCDNSEEGIAEKFSIIIGERKFEKNRYRFKNDSNDLDIIRRWLL